MSDKKEVQVPVTEGVFVKVSKEQIEFLNQILGTVVVNNVTVSLQGLVTTLQALNTPIDPCAPTPRTTL